MPKGKAKGRFDRGKYVATPKLHIKATHDEAGDHLDLTIRLDPENVSGPLYRQIERFLKKVKVQEKH